MPLAGATGGENPARRTRNNQRNMNDLSSRTILDSTSAQPAVSPADLLGCHTFSAMNTRILLFSRAWECGELLGEAGKGYAVARAGRARAPAADFLVDAGGDIFASGHGPDGDGWVVAVANPLNEDENLDVVRLRDQALATSTVARRPRHRGGG